MGVDRRVSVRLRECRPQHVLVDFRSPAAVSVGFRDVGENLLQSDAALVDFVSGLERPLVEMLFDVFKATRLANRGLDNAGSQSRIASLERRNGMRQWNH